MAVAQASSKTRDFLPLDSETGRLIASMDWRSTSLGPIETWPQSLKTATALLLRSPVPIVMLWGEEGVMLYNDAYSVFAGGRHPKLLGSKVREGWPEVADFNDNVMKVGLAGGTLHYKDQELTLYRHGRPEQVWMNLDYSPVPGDDGEPAGVICILAETTERVAAERRREAAEAAVRAERDRTRRVLDGMAEGFGLLDREFRVIDINAEGLRLEERSREEIIGMTHWEAWPGSEESELGRLYKRAMAERVPVSLDHRYVWPDGREAWLEMRAYPTDDGLALFWRDVTERRQAVERLRESDARLRLALDASRLAEVTFHLPNGVAHSPSFAVLFGHPPDKQLTLAEIRAQYHPDDHDRVVAERAAILASGQGFYEIEKRIVWPNGQVRWLYGRGSVARDLEGRAVSVTAVYLDETDRKRTEAALRESEARLAFLDRLGAVSAPLSDADAVLATTTRLLGEHLRLSVCAYADMDEDQDGFTIRGDWAAPGSKSIVGHYSLADFGKLAVKNLSAGLPLVVNDNLRELALEEAATFQRIGIAATICMPLVKEGRLTALMAIHDRVPRVWTEAELGLLREVTARSWAHVERVAATAELRDSEARFRLMADAVPQIVWITDAKGRVEFCNRQWTAYTGVPYEPTTAAEVAANYVHPDDAAATVAAFNEARRTGSTFLVEHRIRSQRDDYRWFLVRGEPYRDPQAGEIVCWFGASADIHDRKIAETELQRLNALLAGEVQDRTRERDRIFEMSNDLFAVAGFDGYLKTINPAWSRLLGYAEDELLARPFIEIVHPDDHAGAAEVIASLRAGEAVRRFQDRLVAADGRHVWIAWAAVPEGDHFYAVGRDVTQDRLRDEALRQAQKMEAVGQLTGGVAHDFNNLLTIIKSSTELLRRPDLGEERRRRYVDAISDTVDRASKLTGQLLAFARRQALKPEVFDAGHRIHSVADMLRTIVGSRVQIVTELGGDACFVEADASQFETALVNMAVNARDAMDGEGVLTIRVRPADAVPPIRGHRGGPGRFVAVSLSDTGAGIPADQIVQIFEPFFTTKEVGKGTGLGLSQVFGFAKQSGGDIQVESKVGRGTTFTLYLPRANEEGAADVATGARHAPEIEDGLGRRVLVVEDNKEVGAFSTQLLQDLGYKTTWAANAAEALRLIAEVDGFDAVFSDVVMPGMSGVELGQEIRRRHPGLPVVLTSGYSHVLAEEGRHGFELLQKPYAVEDLSRVLRRVTRGPRTGQVSGPPS